MNSSFNKELKRLREVAGMKPKKYLCKMYFQGATYGFFVDNRATFEAWEEYTSDSWGKQESHFQFNIKSVDFGEKYKVALEAAIERKNPKVMTEDGFNEILEDPKFRTKPASSRGGTRRGGGGPNFDPFFQVLRTFMFDRVELLASLKGLVDSNPTEYLELMTGVSPKNKEELLAKLKEMKLPKKSILFKAIKNAFPMHWAWFANGLGINQSA